MVAIKDMKEIPKSCCDEDKLCPLFNEETGTCNGVEEFIMTDTTMKRFPICPLTEIEERKVGKWITKDGKEQGYDIAGIKTWYKQIMCNKCGFIENAIEGHTGQYNYCPNCGADMRGAENGKK